jgi:hypothetical protein
MTEPDSTPAAPPAAPPPPAPPAPPAPAPEAAAGLTPDEERQLGELLAKQAATAGGSGAVRMKILNAPEGTTITHGGVTVGTDFSDVPASMAAAMVTAADDAGMEIEQEVS